MEDNEIVWKSIDAGSLKSERKWSIQVVSIAAAMQHPDLSPNENVPCEHKMETTETSDSLTSENLPQKWDKVIFQTSALISAISLRIWLMSDANSVYNGAYRDTPPCYLCLLFSRFQFDTNGDGQISTAELREAMKKLLGQQVRSCWESLSSCLELSVTHGVCLNLIFRPQTFTPSPQSASFRWDTETWRTSCETSTWTETVTWTLKVPIVQHNTALVHVELVLICVCTSLFSWLFPSRIHPYFSAWARIPTCVAEMPKP